MEYYTKGTLIQALHNLGLGKGDTVIVHSNLALMGIIENYSREKLLDTYYTALTDIIGDEGTLCVPSYFWEYATKKIPFDIKLSPVSAQFGIFSQYVTSMKNSVRSCNPIFAVAAVGKNAEYICGGRNRFSHGLDSPWERMYKLNAKVLLIGIGCAYLSFLHYLEYQVGVTYRYNKQFNIPVYDDGKKVFDYTISFVTYLNKNVIKGGDRRTAELYDAGLLKRQQCGSGLLSICQVHPVFEFYKSKFYDNPFCFLKQLPSFSEDDYPLI